VLTDLGKRREWGAVDVVEVFWNAKPDLARLGLKYGSALDPRVERIFNEVRASVANAFPGCATLVRISVRKGGKDEEIRVLRHGCADEEDLEGLQVLIRQAVERGACV
jgi:hypothetical protein